MKYFLSFVTLLVILGFSIPTPKYHYTIGLDIVNDPATAKEATDYIRFRFNQFPEFNDSLDEFRFQSDVYVSDVEFYDLSLDNGYIMTKFERIMK